MNNITNLILLLSFINPLFGQYISEGTIVDSVTSEPLPFVNISFNNNPRLGICSDIDGKFNFEHQDALYSIQLSYLGYQRQNILLDSLSKPLILALHKTNFSLEEVVVIAGENPAYRIIRKATKNRKKHDPEKIEAYTFSSYNKLRVFDQYNSPTPRDTISVDKRYNFFYSMIEILSETKYIAPDKKEDNIIATKVSGFKNPTFVTAMSEGQLSNFHTDNLLILDKEYLNPISGGCITKYEYRLEDTIFQENDTIYIISFFPRKGRNFDALKGVLYINSNGYAIQNVIAEPAGRQKLHLRIEQQYSFIDGQNWFPTQLNFEIELSPRKKDTLTVQGKKYISNINLNPKLKSKDFGLNKVTINDNAHLHDSVFWIQNRIHPLSYKEKETYRIIDKLSKTLPLDLLMGTINEIGDERIQLDGISINYTQLMEFNLHEQFRLGLGLYTSYKMCPYISVGGYFAHGFKDKKWKYGGSITIRPILNKDIGFQISYIDDIIEPAPIIQNTHSLSRKVLPVQSFIRRNILDQMDKTYEFEISSYFRVFRYLRTRVFANWSHKIPLYNYRFVKDNEIYQSFKFTRVGIQFRFCYKEDYIQLGSSNLKVRSRFPIIYLSYTKGIKGFLDSGFEYHKIIAGIESSFFVKGFGRTSWFLHGGWVEGETPYPILFNGRGSFDRWRMFMIKNSFQTMRPNEFLADKFVYLFLEHNFGSLLLNIGQFKPEVKIYQAIGFGWLDNSQDHHDISIQDMSSGYFETGIMLSNLIRLNVLNIGYFGVGAGVFVRYGAYYLSANLVDNFAFKIDMTFSF